MSTIEISHPTNRPNFTRLYLGNIVLWFSYETVVAFHVPGQPRVVSENAWGPTTGKHLNEIDGGNKSTRIPRAEFVSRLNELMQKLDTALS